MDRLRRKLFGRKKKKTRTRNMPIKNLPVVDDKGRADDKDMLDGYGYNDEPYGPWKNGLVYKEWRNDREVDDEVNWLYRLYRRKDSQGYSHTEYYNSVLFRVFMNLWLEWAEQERQSGRIGTIQGKIREGTKRVLKSNNFNISKATREEMMENVKNMTDWKDWYGNPRTPTYIDGAKYYLYATEKISSPYLDALLPVEELNIQWKQDRGEWEPKGAQMEPEATKSLFNGILYEELNDVIIQSLIKNDKYFKRTLQAAIDAYYYIWEKLNEKFNPEGSDKVYNANRLIDEENEKIRRIINIDRQYNTESYKRKKRGREIEVERRKRNPEYNQEYYRRQHKQREEIFSETEREKRGRKKKERRRKKKKRQAPDYDDNSDDEADELRGMMSTTPRLKF